MYLARLGQKHRVVISHRNQGLGDNLAAVANAWHFAKQTGRELVVVWIPCRYLQENQRNGFSYFFQLPPILDGVRVMVPEQLDPLSRFIIAHSDFFDGLVPDPHLFTWLAGYGIAHGLGFKTWCTRLKAKIDGRRKARRERLAQQIYAERDFTARLVLLNGCIVPRPLLKPFYDALRLAQLQPRVDDFARIHFSGKKVVGAHVRFETRQMGKVSDHHEYWHDPAQSLQSCADQIHAACARLAPAETVVFLATDSMRVQDFFAQEFSNLVTLEKPFANDETVELHDALPVETAEAAVVEMFLLAQSDLLVRYPPKSYFSFYAGLYVPEWST